MIYRKTAKALIRFMSITLAAFSLFFGISVYESETAGAKTTIGEIDAKISALEDELKKASEARQSAEKAYQSVKDQYDNIKERKTAIDSEIDAIYNESEILRVLIAGYSDQKAALDEKINKTQQKLDERLDILRERLRVSYEDGNSNYFVILFNSEGLYDFLTSADRLSVLIEHDNELIKECESICQELQTQKNALSDITLSAENKSAELKSSLLLLQEKQNEVLEMMQTLEADTEAAKNALLEAEKEEDAFQEELQERLEERSELNNGSYTGGDFVWPLPAKYKKISSKFGNRIHPVLGTPQFHRGIDIPAPNKTEIYCVSKGTVIETGNDYGNGKYVIVDHGGGISTMYAHLSRIDVKKGDILDQGEVLGLVGMTGYATGYHLHLSVYENGKAVDPQSYY